MPTGFARRLAWLSSVVLLFGESAVSTAARPVTHRMPSFAERQRGWMARDANPKHAWLYVNGNNNIVEVYDLDARPGPRLIGTIADGLNNPESMTVDQKGTLYVANDTTPFVTIYPAGATTPSLTLTQGLSGAFGAAADASGNVWVTNPANPPEILVYPAGQSTPSTTITGPLVNHPGQDFFDAAGNLWYNDYDGFNMIPAGSFTPQSTSYEPPPQPSGIALSTDGTLYAANFVGDGHDIVAYKPGAAEPFKKLHFNGNADYMASGTIGRHDYIFATNRFSNTVTFFPAHSRNATLVLSTGCSGSNGVAYKPAGVP
jgi:hypothetical protein